MYIECRHIFPSGKKCESPALTGKDFCYFHHNKRNHKPRSHKPGEPSTLTHHLPQLEDGDAILTALSDVILALALNRIDPRRAQILIYGLQVASQHSKRLSYNTSVETVRETYEAADGTLVGPREEALDTEDINLDEPDEDNMDEDEKEDRELHEFQEQCIRKAEEQTCAHAREMQRRAELLKEQEKEWVQSSKPTSDTDDTVGPLPQLQATAEPRTKKKLCRTTGHQRALLSILDRTSLSATPVAPHSSVGVKIEQAQPGIVHIIKGAATDWPCVYLRRLASY